MYAISTMTGTLPLMAPVVRQALHGSAADPRHRTDNVCGMSAPADESPAGRSLVVKLTWGEDGPERCAQAFTVAATGVAAGVPVSLWLTGEASWFALPGRAEAFRLAHAPPLADLRDAVLAGGTITLCTQCAARRGIGADDLLPGVRIGGAAAFVSEALAVGAQALVY